MNANAMQELLVSQIGIFGAIALAILGALIVLSVGFLVFRWGWRSLLNYPGGLGYNPRYGSGLSRFQKGRRNASGGANLLA